MINKESIAGFSLTSAIEWEMWLEYSTP